MKLLITEPYLWFPVDTKNPEVKLHLYVNEEKFQEVDVQLGEAGAGFYFSMDVSKHLGQEIEIKSDVEEEKLFHIFCSGEKVHHVYPFRPQLHFAPECGWMNDPNGLVYADGVYHLFYQWNPYGVIWGNMHWGHAVSKDLITWEHKPVAMEPDEYGTMFSGCGFRDKENAAGYGKDALLFFYTSAGGTNQWSVEAGNLHTQRLAVSVDNCRMLKKKGTVLEHIVGGNRDPKVFYHRESNAYVMVLYLDESEFAVFRSDDLIHWEMSQRFSVEGMWECPDLFELPVENAGGEKKWVFWSADGYYVIGAFDGYQFVPESERKSAYSTKLPYAAQTYSGLEGRVVSVAWLRTGNIQGGFRGMMALPAELSLIKEGEQYNMKFRPVKELEQYKKTQEVVCTGKKSFEIPLADTAAELTIKWGQQNIGCTTITAGAVSACVDFETGALIIENKKCCEEPFVIPFNNEKAFQLKMIIDRGIMEFFGNDGTIYAAVEAEETVLRKTLVVKSGVEAEEVQYFMYK